MTGTIEFVICPLWLIGGAILIVLLVLLLRQQKQKDKSAVPLPASKKPEKTECGLVSEKEETDPDVEEDVGGTPSLLQYSFSQLEYLSIAGNWEVHLQCRAPENECKIGIDPAFARFVKVEPAHNGLLIRYIGKKSPEEPMTIDISTTGVPEQVKSIGKSQLWIDSVETERFVCKVTDGGKVEMSGAKVGELTVKLTGKCRAECGGEFESAELEVAGGSNGKLRGSVKKLFVRLCGASKAEAGQAEKAEIDVSGASKLKLEVTGKLEGDLSGGSTLKYRGEIDTSSIRISGSSRLKNWN